MDSKSKNFNEIYEYVTKELKKGQSIEKIQKYIIKKIKRNSKKILNIVDGFCFACSTIVKDVSSNEFKNLQNFIFDELIKNYPDNAVDILNSFICCYPNNSLFIVRKFVINYLNNNTIDDFYYWVKRSK